MSFLTKESYHLEEAEAEGSWAISYGDMITLLLSFFVIFFTTDPKEEKSRKLNDYLAFTMDGLAALKAPEGSRRAGKTSPPDLRDLDIKVHSIGDKVIITFGKFSFFESGSEVVRAEGVKVLEGFTQKYLPFVGNYQLSVKGFTDQRKVVRNLHRYHDNLELSALRSISAMRVLQRAGIPLDRMEIAGAGEMRAVEKVFAEVEKLTQKEVDQISRTVVMVITPQKESWL